MPTPEAQKAADDVFICTTDRETRHNIALALDRFAGQRGAEAEERFQQLLKAASTFEWKFEEGAPPQTGGGDAPALSPEQLARDPIYTEGDLGRLAAEIRKLHDAQAGGGDAEERARAILDLIAAQPGCRIDPHARDYAAKLIAGSHREGAKAMREPSEAEITAALAAARKPKGGTFESLEHWWREDMRAALIAAARARIGE